jgi:hypothetical protein
LLWPPSFHSNEDIAGRLDYALATVERRLRLIRALWEEYRPA